MKRVFLIVLDSCGIGALPDAADFGDAGTHTLRSCYETGELSIPNLLSLGLGNVEGTSCLQAQAKHPIGSSGRMAERSKGKDTTIGHWEMAGIISPKPFPTYPNGFPKEIIDAFAYKTGRTILCNRPYSGTEVIQAYGDEQVRSEGLIVYTSADSVFQVAAHEDVVPVEELYEYCRIARQMLQGEHAVGRVIARPFVGSNGVYTRTANRHDFSLEPTRETMLDALSRQGKDVIAVGKITDIFAGRGMTESIFTHSNAEGMEAAMQQADRDFEGLCFVNLVDFDMIYGHRNNASGYAQALNEFDLWLGDFLKKLQEDDVLMITADHGCDPGDVSTDHTREYVPILMYGRKLAATSLGTRGCFADVAATVCEFLDTPYETEGVSFAPEHVQN